MCFKRKNDWVFWHNESRIFYGVQNTFEKYVRAHGFPVCDYRLAVILPLAIPAIQFYAPGKYFKNANFLELQVTKLIHPC